MSKTTKIIAALGVVAGLGVAALPAFTYAAETVSGNADVYVDVLPAIAMTIVGNNDDNGHAGTTGTNDDVAVKNPTDASKIGSLDISSFEVGTATKASSSWTSLLPNSSKHGNNGSGVDNGFYSTITVYTNNASGYNLGISGNGTSNALGDLVKQYSGTAPATPATIEADGIVIAGHAGWGYSKTVQTDATDDQTANYSVAANNALTTSSTATTSGDETIVFYGVSTAADQETGTYKATVTYTATTN